MIVGEMGELRPADHVADGVDAPVGGLEVVIHLDAVRGVGDVGPLEAERLDVGLAAGGDEEMRALKDHRLAVLHEMHADTLHRAFDPLHPRIGMHYDLRIGEPLDQHGDRVRILVRQKVCRIEHGDVRAKHAVGLSELEPYGSAAEHDEVLNPLAHIEDRLVGEVGHLVEPRDRRDGRHRSRCYDESSGANQHASGLHGELVEEARARLDHADAEPRHALD